MDSAETVSGSLSGVSTIVLLSLAMLVGCYLAGSIPLAFPLSEDRLHLVSVLGAGLLIGTALAVIIPEGVNALFADSHSHPHHHHDSHESVEAARIVTQRKILGDAHQSSVVTSSGEESHHVSSGIEPHSLIGLMLVLGFVFMMLVDQLSSRAGHSHSGGSSPTDGQPAVNITATLGLVVHAAADGVALGAAAKSSHKEVEMIVFLAIMLHKAPAAFGLVTFLLSEGLDRVRIRRHLLVFAAAAPVLSLLTFFGLSQQNRESLSSSHTTGSAMLFSAGTFLYVSTVHVLPEIARSRPPPVGNSGCVELGKESAPGVGHFNKKELSVIVVGALMPLLLSLGHHH